MYLEPCQTSKVECLTKKVNRFKPLTIFTKQSILDPWQDSGYASGSLKLFCHSFKRDTWEGWYMPNWLYSIHSKQRMFPCSNVIHGSTTFKLTKVNKDYRKTLFKLLNLVFLFFLLFSSFQCTRKIFHKQKWCVSFFTRLLHASN